MYKKLSTLPSDSVQILDSLIEEVSFNDKNIRLGANGINKLSKYSHSRWFDWTASQRSLFKMSFGTESEKAIVGWFLTLPESIGFLDLMTYWQDKVMAGTIVSYALNNDQRIWLNNNEIILNRGEGLEFSLKVPHEIKSSNIQQNWACIMQLDNNK